MRLVIVGARVTYHNRPSPRSCMYQYMSCTLLCTEKWYDKWSLQTCAATVLCEALRRELVYVTSISLDQQSRAGPFVPKYEMWYNFGQAFT